MPLRNVKLGKNVIIYHPELVNLYDCEIGDNCKIGSFTEIGTDVVIGNNCKIQAHVYIPKGVIIKNNVFIGPRVTFTNDKYPPSEDPNNWDVIYVNDDVSIGGGSVILPGVILGTNCLIGGGSVVTKHVENNVVVCGNPARFLRFRNEK